MIPSCVSFLPSLFLLFQFLTCWASCHFHCTGFSLHSASTVWAFAKLGFCYVQSLPHWGRAEVVSARLNRVAAPDMLGKCVVSLVLSHSSKDLKQQTSVTAKLQLSFIRKAKGSISSRQEGGLTQKQRLILGSSSSVFCLLPLSLPCVNWAN